MKFLKKAIAIAALFELNHSLFRTSFKKYFYVHANYLMEFINFTKKYIKCDFCYIKSSN
jgi:hypothetical protein